MPFDRLIGVGRGAERHQLARPGRLVELAPQHLEEVDLDEDRRREVVARTELELGLVAAREAVVAGVGAAAIRVERPVERHSLRRGLSADRQVTPDSSPRSARSCASSIAAAPRLQDDGRGRGGGRRSRAVETGLARSCISALFRHHTSSAGCQNSLQASGSELPAFVYATGPNPSSSPEPGPLLEEVSRRETDLGNEHHAVHVAHETWLASIASLPAGATSGSTRRCHRRSSPPPAVAAAGDCRSGCRRPLQRRSAGTGGRRPGRSSTPPAARHKGSAASGSRPAVPFHVGEVLGGRRAEQEEPEDRAHEPWLDPPDRLDDDQPATLSSTPRGIAMVTLAQMPRCFVRSGGRNRRWSAIVATSTIQKHSRRPSGATSQASSIASGIGERGEGPSVPDGGGRSAAAAPAC